MNPGRFLMIWNTGPAVRYLHVAVVLTGFAYIASSEAARAPRDKRVNGSVHLQLQNADGKNIAYGQMVPGQSDSAVLTLEKAYQPGDSIVFGGVPWMSLRFDSTTPE